MDANYLLVRGALSAFRLCAEGNSSSQIELAYELPNDWNKFMTEGSHTFTSSVSDLTCMHGQKASPLISNRVKLKQQQKRTHTDVRKTNLYFVDQKGCIN